jgi:hypothetical protein
MLTSKKQSLSDTSLPDYYYDVIPFYGSGGQETKGFSVMMVKNYYYTSVEREFVVINILD